MQTISIQEVQAHLTKLIEQAEAGETIFILEAGKPRAMLAPIQGVATASPKAAGLRQPRHPGTLPHWPGEVVGSLSREEIYSGDA